jgi:FkbM family methyltransferase
VILTKIGRRIALYTQVLDNPKALRLLGRGISTDFVNLNQPWLVEAGVRTILDIGAGIGHFASIIHEILPEALIYAFEPLEGPYANLKDKEKRVKQLTALNIALGDTDGEMQFHVSDYWPSSSILPMADLHRENYPFTSGGYTKTVRSARLDDIAKDVKIEDNLLIKIDVQGFEDRVLAGGRDTVKRAGILILETSFQPLYVGQALFEDIYDFLKEDFRYIGALSESRSPIDGSVLQEDSIFANRFK